jgi:hypothetical protein
VNAFISYLSELPENADRRIPSKIKSPVVDVPDTFLIEDRDMELMQKAAADSTTKISAEARAYFWVATDTWQRVGAITSLRVQDVSFEKRQFTFRASKRRGSAIFSPTIGILQKPAYSPLQTFSIARVQWLLPVVRMS